MNRSRFPGFLLPLLLAWAVGCGGHSDPGAPAGEPGETTIGLTRCYECHGDLASPAFLPKVFGDLPEARGAREGWLSGPHANNETFLDGIDLSPSNIGFPFYGFEGLGQKPDCTLECHDRTGDGKLLKPFFETMGIDALGKVDRPVVGCEACHGGGLGHPESGLPLPETSPGAARCGICHSERLPRNHLTYHPECDHIFESYRVSAHARSIDGPEPAGGGDKTARRVCTRCHTDEGARGFVPVVGGTATREEIEAALQGGGGIRQATPVQCRTCHDAHNPSRLLGERAPGLPERWSAEFETCTSCHQLLDAQGGLLAAAYHDPSVDPSGTTALVITDTHFDDPSTPEIEGYVVDPAGTHRRLPGNRNSGGCPDCHDPHAADPAINREWAMSRHAGEIARRKAADPRAALTGTAAPAWAGEDFKLPTAEPCQRCHTSTGFRNFANGPPRYDPRENAFVATGEQKELLYCWACHLTNTGILRNPGPFARTAPYGEPADRIAAVPDEAGSNLCLACHGGLRSGAQIRAKAFPGEIVGQPFRAFRAHGGAAGGIVHRTIGYEFEGREYADDPPSRHVEIGTGAAPSTGGNGPCAGCHMRGGGPHRFQAAARDESGRIAEIPALEPTCRVCHAGGQAMDPDRLNRLREEYGAALGALEGMLARRGIHRVAADPYFSSVPDAGGESRPSAFDQWPERDSLGAAFNLDLLSSEPGAYVHDGAYARKLLYDSIDYLDDGRLDGSVETTLVSGPAFEFLEGARRKQ